jgi:hypothetical protein
MLICGSNDPHFKKRKDNDMGMLSGLGDLVKQFSSAEGGAAAQQTVGSAPQSAIASGLAEVFRSSETAPFAQQASQLFANSNGSQQASVLNALIAAAGPTVLAKLGGGSSLAGLLGSSPGTITPEQAASVNPEEVQALAEHAEKQDPSIMDRISEVYSAHPQMIQALGAAALALAAAHISKNQG